MTNSPSYIIWSFLQLAFIIEMTFTTITCLRRFNPRCCLCMRSKSRGSDYLKQVLVHGGGGNLSYSSWLTRERWETIFSRFLIFMCSCPHWIISTRPPTNFSCWAQSRPSIYLSKLLNPYFRKTPIYRIIKDFPSRLEPPKLSGITSKITLKQLDDDKFPSSTP